MVDSKQKVKYHHLISARCWRHLWRRRTLKSTPIWDHLGWSGMTGEGVGIAGIADIAMFARNRKGLTTD